MVLAKMDTPILVGVLMIAVAALVGKEWIWNLTKTKSL